MNMSSNNNYSKVATGTIFSCTTATLAGAPPATSSKAAVPSPVQQVNRIILYYNLEILKNNVRIEIDGTTYIHRNIKRSSSGYNPRKRTSLAQKSRLQRLLPFSHPPLQGQGGGTYFFPPWKGASSGARWNQVHRLLLSCRLDIGSRASA